MLLLLVTNPQYDRGNLGLLTPAARSTTMCSPKERDTNSQDQDTFAPHTEKATLSNE